MSILLSLFYFFYFCVVGVYIIFLPKMLSLYGYGADEIGIIFAAAPLVRMLLPLLFVKGFRLGHNSFIIALGIMALSSFSFYHSVDDFYSLLLSNIMLGVGMSLVLPYVELIALEKLGKSRYGRVRLFGSLGFVLVALILVEVLQGMAIVLDFLLLLTLATALVAFSILKVADKKDTSADALHNDINIFKEYKLWLALILMQVSFGAFYNFFTIYATDHGISLQTTIYLWSVGVAAEILMLYFQGGLLKQNLLKILQLTLFVTIIRWYLLYAFAENILVLYFSQILHAFSFALFHSAAISYLHSFYKNKALSQQFFSGVTYGLGGFSGALLSGYIYKYFPEYLFLSSSLLVAIGFVSLLAWERSLRAKSL